MATRICGCRLNRPAFQVVLIKPQLEFPGSLRKFRFLEGLLCRTAPPWDDVNGPACFYPLLVVLVASNNTAIPILLFFLFCFLDQQILAIDPSDSLGRHSVTLNAYYQGS